MRAAGAFAEWAAGLSFDDVPRDVVEAANLHVLDAVGCGLAAHALGLGTEGREVLAELGGRPEASVIGLEAALPAPSAAFSNALMCHALDYDDTHPASIVHVSAAVVPAAIAAAEAAGADGREFLTAVVIGNELACRLGMAASGEFHRRGFHPTGVCGVFGATAAACRLLGLDAATGVSALGIAGSMASGLLAFLEEGTQTKPFNPASAAHDGILAARLAASGAEGPSSVLDGRYGLFHAFLGRKIDLSAQLADLGARWETANIAYKPYPACHFMHGSLGSTATLLDEVEPQEVEQVVVTVTPVSVATVLEPVDQKLAPRSAYEAKFSLPYATAAMLVHGRVNLETFASDALEDGRVRELAAKVGYETRDYPSDFAGGVRIRLRDGTVLEADSPYPLGSLENPLAPRQVREKYRENATLAGAPPALEEELLALDGAADVRSAFRLLTLAAAGAPAAA